MYFKPKSNLKEWNKKAKNIVFREQHLKGHQVHSKQRSRRGGLGNKADACHAKRSKCANLLIQSKQKTLVSTGLK